MHANDFTYAGTIWRRDRLTQTSNSGKTTYTKETTFTAADGRVVSRDAGLPTNRRSDPNRNWGLGRD